MTATAEVGTVLVEREEQAVALPGEVNEIIRLAIEGRADVGVIERLVALQERATDRAAEAAMNDAVRLFQEACPLIPKTKTASIATKSGGKFGYTYADLPTIVETIRPVLAKCGLAYTFDSKLEGGLISVTCTLHHVDGAKRSATFTGPTASNSGASEIQKAGAALTYGRRQALIQVLGLTTADDDTDGAGGVGDEVETVDAEQLANLQAVFDEVRGTFNEPKFFAFFECDALAEIPGARYAEALAILEKKRK